MTKKTKKNAYPLLPLRDIVVFPYMIIPLFVGRKRSVDALDDVMEGREQKILLVTQKNPNVEEPGVNDIYNVGTLVNILQLLKLPDGTVKILVEGEARFNIDFVDSYFDKKTNRHYFKGVGEIAETTNKIDDIKYQVELQAIKKTIQENFEKYIKLNRKIPPEIASVVNQIEDYSKFVDTISSYFSLKIEEKQLLLEINDIKERLEKLLLYINNEMDVLQIQQKIRTRVKGQMEKSQRDYYLQEQLKAIQQELHANEEGLDEITEFEIQVEEKKLAGEVKAKALAEIRKLRTMNQSTAEAVVVRNYLDWLLNLPWNEDSKLKKDLDYAEKVLQKHHHGLNKVKERIIEFLAVQSRVKKMSGQILCLVGPPGVGKTSLGRSVAEATGREFHRIALGGVHDESEIRGHRKTYIGSMPGKIIQAMRKVKTSNPLILLDEIDKLGHDWRGDPASALLEVLDPEQNKAFTDNYLEVPFDLSNVFFITTANTFDIPAPLLDRMEIIRLSGYTEDEKLQIAKTHLVQKQIGAHGLSSKEIEFKDESILSIIRHYTREAGVRSLEREIARICRKAVLDITKKKTKSIIVDEKKVQEYCGVQKFTYGIIQEENFTGIVNGLAWTEVGGDLLTIEAVLFPGGGKHILTGQLGDVMQESIHTAISLIRSRAEKLKIKEKVFKDKDIHVHVPEGAIPKDGPSAGIGMYVAILSAIIEKPIRNDVAMTGEITLNGRVLAIGGLREKLLAAHRGSIKTVLIPYENKKDLEEIPEKVKKDLEIIPIKTVDEAIDHVFYKDKSKKTAKKEIPAVQESVKKIRKKV